ATATQFLFKAETNRGPGFGNTENVYYTPNSDVLYNPDLKWETTTNRNLGLDFGILNGRVTGSFDVYHNTTEDLLLKRAISPIAGFDTEWKNIGTTSDRGVEFAVNGYIVDNNEFSLAANFNIGANRSKIDELDGTNSRFYQSNWASTDLNNINDYYLEVGGT